MNPRYTFTPTIVRDLMDVEGLTTLPPAVAERLRQQAPVRSTHYSTRIEGNRLTLAEAEQVVLSGRRFPGRERDVREVQNYYRALQRVEEWAAQQTHPHHNYYEGRAEADLTGWVAYFARSMAAVFRRVADEVRAQAGQPAAPEPPQSLSIIPLLATECTQ